MVALDTRFDILDYYFHYITSSIQLNNNISTSHSDISGLTHISHISYILILYSSIGSSSSNTSKIVILLSLKFFLQLLFRIYVRTLIWILFLNYCRFVNRRLLNRWLKLFYVTSFLHLLHLFTLFFLFHLNSFKHTCCLKIYPYFCFYYFESIFFLVLKRL